MRKPDMWYMRIGLFSIFSLLAGILCCCTAIASPCDLNDDYLVDWNDIKILADQWLDGYDLTDFAELAKCWPDSPLHIQDSPDDLIDTHPRLLMRGYGTDNGLWALMNPDSPTCDIRYVEIWRRIENTILQGGNGYDHLSAACAYIISKKDEYGQACYNYVRSGGYSTDSGVEGAAFAYSFDAIADGTRSNGTPWLTASEKAAAYASLQSLVNATQFPSREDTPTHNYGLAEPATHTSCVYMLRGVPGYESFYLAQRDRTLELFNNRINGRCGVSGSGADLVFENLANQGPRCADGYPHEGPQYGAYQFLRALPQIHSIETSEYPNPAVVRDDHQSGFTQNAIMGWLALLPPYTRGELGEADWIKVSFLSAGRHSVMSGMRFCSSSCWAYGDRLLYPSTSLKISGKTMARVGEWFYNVIRSEPQLSAGNDMNGGDDLPGLEAVWFNPQITPLSPEEAGLPRYIHLNDSELHVYRSSWRILDATGDDTYIYFRNSGHDGHHYWDEGHGGTSGCFCGTSTHDSADNGHFTIYRKNRYIVEGNSSDPSSSCNVLQFGEQVKQQVLDEGRGNDYPQLGQTDCIGIVDSDYGHAIDAIVGPAYLPGRLNDPNGYHRFFFVFENPMYLVVIDEFENNLAVTKTFRVYDMGTTQNASDPFLYENSMARYEFYYPNRNDPNYVNNAPSGRPIQFQTNANRIMFLCHPNPLGQNFSKSYPNGLCKANIENDTIIYNPKDLNYSAAQSNSSISGNAKLFAERSGGVLVFKATSASGSQYAISCASPVNMTASDNKANLYVYGTGTQRVAINSPAGGDVFYIEAGKTFEKTLSGSGGTDVMPPVPSPLTWAIPPAADSSSSIVMTATTATDTSGPVEYYFENSPTGSIHSTWQTGTTWTATGLSANTQYTFRVKARDRATPTPNETGWSPTASATTLDSGPPPTITATATDASASEPSNTGQFTVTRNSSGTADKIVYYTVSGTATAASDYQTLSGSVTIAGGTTTATITVTPVNDTLLESNETVILTISPNAGYNIGSPNSATVTITDDEWANCEDPGWTVLTCDSFEDGWGSYTSSGTTAVVNCTSGNHATDGTCVADIESTGSFAHTSGLNLTDYKQLKVKFDFFPSTNVGNAEGFKVEYYDGTTWQLLKNYVKDTNFTVGTQYTNVELYAFKGQYAFPSAAKIRFTCVANSSSDDIYIDNIRVMANVNASASEVELFFDDFETGNLTAGLWTVLDGNAKADGAADHTSGSGLLIKLNSWAQKMIASSGFQNIHVKYWRKTVNFEPADNDKYYTEWSVDGTIWNTLETVTSTLDWVYVDNVCASGANNNSGFRIRLRMACNETNDNIYIDDVKITGYQLP